MKYILTLILLLLFMYVLVQLTNYNDRMEEYNRHMCEDIYGLDEHCQKIVAPIPESERVQ